MGEWVIGIAIAVVAASAGWGANRIGRVAALERRVAQLEAINRKTWLYCRVLIDHIYKGRPSPPPPPPADIFGEEEK